MLTLEENTLPILLKVRLDVKVKEISDVVKCTTNLLPHVIIVPAHCSQSKLPFVLCLRNIRVLLHQIKLSYFVFFLRYLEEKISIKIEWSKKLLNLFNKYREHCERNLYKNWKWKRWKAPEQHVQTEDEWQFELRAVKVTRRQRHVPDFAKSSGTVWHRSTIHLVYAVGQ